MSSPEPETYRIVGVKRWVLVAALISSLLAATVFSVLSLSAEAGPAPAHDTTPLGTWISMPPNTSCDLSINNNVSSPLCELLGNSTYRGLVTAQQGVAMSGYFALLSVRCIVLSNTIGAQLTLQYAITAGSVNSTNFQTLGSIYIDGVNGPGCTTPNSFGTSLALALNATAANQGYIFRVVGVDGGGAGDNPRFSTVNVILDYGAVRNFLPIVISVSNTAIGVAVYTTVRSSSSVTVTWRWMATNSSSTPPGCGSSVLGGTFVCLQKGTASCTIAAGAANCNTVTTTYPTAFTGTTQGIASDASAGQGAVIIAGIDNLLSAQTLTV